MSHFCSRFTDAIDNIQLRNGFHLANALINARRALGNVSIRTFCIVIPLIGVELSIWNSCANPGHPFSAGSVGRGEEDVRFGSKVGAAKATLGAPVGFSRGAQAYFHLGLRIQE